MKHGTEGHEGMAPPFKKMRRAMEAGEEGAGMKGGKKGGKARMQGLSLAGRKGASRRKP